MGRKNNNSKFMALGAVVAAGVGYAAGLLTAPKSGKDTRKDIAHGANKTKVKADKQLKKLHSELSDLIKEGDAKAKGAKTKASKELKESVAKAKVAKEKAREILSAIHEGGSDDPNLQKAIKEVQAAKKNLGKYLKK